MQDLSLLNLGNWALGLIYKEGFIILDSFHCYLHIRHQLTLNHWMFERTDLWSFDKFSVWDNQWCQGHILDPEFDKHWPLPSWDLVQWCPDPPCLSPIWESWTQTGWGRAESTASRTPSSSRRHCWRTTSWTTPPRTSWCPPGEACMWHGGQSCRVCANWSQSSWY